MTTELQVTDTLTGTIAEMHALPERRPLDVLPWLPCTLTLELPLIRFTLHALLNLEPGALLETGSHQSMDLPLRMNGMLLAWTEFEVIGERLAARITDLV